VTRNDHTYVKGLHKRHDNQMPRKFPNALSVVIWFRKTSTCDKSDVTVH